MVSMHIIRASYQASITKPMARIQCYIFLNTSWNSNYKSQKIIRDGADNPKSIHGLQAATYDLSVPGHLWLARMSQYECASISLVVKVWNIFHNESKYTYLIS